MELPERWWLSSEIWELWENKQTRLQLCRSLTTSCGACDKNLFCICDIANFLGFKAKMAYLDDSSHVSTFSKFWPQPGLKKSQWPPTLAISLRRSRLPGPGRRGSRLSLGEFECLEFLLVGDDELTIIHQPGMTKEEKMGLWLMTGRTQSSRFTTLRTGTLPSPLPPLPLLHQYNCLYLKFHISGKIFMTQFL